MYIIHAHACIKLCIYTSRLILVLHISDLLRFIILTTEFFASKDKNEFTMINYNDICFKLRINNSVVNAKILKYKINYVYINAF